MLVVEAETDDVEDDLAPLDLNGLLVLVAAAAAEPDRLRGL